MHQPAQARKQLMTDRGDKPLTSRGVTAGLAAAAFGGGLAIEVATGNSVAALVTALSILGVPLLWRRLRR